MKNTIIFLCASFLCCNMAFGADASCEAKAADKKLAGAAKDSFIKKCEKDTASPCGIKAAEKKLSGAAKNSFMKKCEKDSAAAKATGATEACNTKAAEKKLAGAAKNSFVKKCVSDAGK